MSYCSACSGEARVRSFLTRSSMTTIVTMAISRTMYIVRSVVVPVVVPVPELWRRITSLVVVT